MRRVVITSFLAAVWVILLAVTCWGASVSGSVTYSGAAGRIYVGLSDSTGMLRYGTSVAATGSGTYSFRVDGVPADNYTVGAFLDPSSRNDAVLYAGSLFGFTQISVADADVTGFNIALAAPAAEAPVAVSTDGMFALFMDGAGLLFWNNAYAPSGFIAAESYNVYWGTNADVGPGKTTNGGSLSAIPSTTDQVHQGIPGLVTGTSYYFAVQSRLNGNSSALTRIGPFTAGAPTGGHRITGTVRCSGFVPAKPVTVVAYSDQGVRYATKVQPTSDTFSFSLPGVTSGFYHLLAFVDQNDNGRWDVGDVSTVSENHPVVVADGDAAAATPLTIYNRKSSSSVTSFFNPWSSLPYQLNILFRNEAQRVAHVVLDAGNGVAKSSLVSSWGAVQWSGEVPNPKVGDIYSATVTYTDGSTETVSIPITGLVGAPPVAVAPIGQGASDSLNPTFAWRTAELPAGDVHYEVELSSDTGESWTGAAPAGSRSLKYTGSPLTPGHDYWYSIAAVDSFGNRSTEWQAFTPTAGGPAVTAVTPASAPQGSTVTVTGSGFSGGAIPTVSFNGILSGSVTVVSDGELNATVPAGASTGPVLVTAGEITASSSADFVPTVTYRHSVTDSNGAPLANVTAEELTHPSLTALSDGAGSFVISALPAGVPVQLKLSAAGVLPVYSAEMLYSSDASPAGSYAMYTQSQVNGWNGGATGNGVIKSRAVDTAGANLQGVAVRAFSTVHGSTGYYKVAYRDAGGSFCSSCTSTAADGQYFVLNVEEGDVVVVSAQKTGYAFDSRTFHTHAASVSEGRLVGEGSPVITAVTPTETVPGGTITITGANFIPNLDDNEVIFANHLAGTVLSASATELVVQVPCGAGEGAVIVSVNGKTVTSATGITFGAPTITGFTPLSGRTSLPTQVTITGNNFSACNDSQVNFYPNNPGGGIISITPTEIVTYITIDAQTGPLTVITPYGVATSEQSFTPLAALNVSVTGSGSVNAVVPVASYACAATACTGDFSYGTSFTLRATPAAGYRFSGWSGACAGLADCTVTLFGDTVVGASFVQEQYVKGGGTFFPTIKDGLAASPDGTLLQAQARTFVESPKYNRPGVRLKLKGGYDSSFGTITGYTTVDGSLTVVNGTVRVERVKIR